MFLLVASKIVINWSILSPMLILIMCDIESNADTATYLVVSLLVMLHNYKFTTRYSNTSALMIIAI